MKAKTILDFDESLLGSTVIWYGKDTDGTIEVFIDLLEKGITIKMTHWEYTNFVQNIAMGDFKLSQMRAIEARKAYEARAEKKQKKKSKKNQA